MLRERCAQLPGVVDEALLVPLLDLPPGGLPSPIVVTGAGASVGPARLLVCLLDELGERARFAPLSSFVPPGYASTTSREPSRDPRESHASHDPDESRDTQNAQTAGRTHRTGHAGPTDCAAHGGSSLSPCLPGVADLSGPRRGTLVVLSQGLSPNAGLALRAAERFEKVVVLTSADPRSSTAEGERAAKLRARGILIWTLPCQNEAGLLVRLLGPAVALIAVIRLAGAQNPPCLLSQGDLVERCRGALLSAPERAHRALSSCGPEALLAPIGLVTTGGYDSLCHGLSWKWLEGVLSPLPPIWDVLQVAHGPFQQLHDHPFTLISLEHAGGSADPELLDRLERMLVPGRHHLVRLGSPLPAPLCLLDHDAQLNALMLEALSLRPRDLVKWPGHGCDGPLYELGLDGF